MRRAVLFLACVAGVVCITGGVAAVTVGCGTPPIASPEHLGSWAGSGAGGLQVEITVAGEPGNYTAECAYTMQSMPDINVTFSGGKVDELGNVTFDNQDGSAAKVRLTLGPVSGDGMTAYILEGDTAVDMVRQ
jgi:hypothetical protein